MEEKTLEVSVAKFMELCRTDARMDALISYMGKSSRQYVHRGL